MEHQTEPLTIVLSGRIDSNNAAATERSLYERLAGKENKPVVLASQECDIAVYEEFLAVVGKAPHADSVFVFIVTVCYCKSVKRRAVLAP